MTGILDEYPGAAAAYSLRLLNTDYTGDAVIVRRASDNTTQSIGFIDGELDTGALNTFCSGTDGFVTTWFDQSGNGNDATQTTASRQPKIYDSTNGIFEVNGKPSVGFNAPAAHLIFDNLVNCESVFSVAKMDAFNSYNYSLYKSTGDLQGLFYGGTSTAPEGLGHFSIVAGIARVNSIVGQDLNQHLGYFDNVNLDLNIAKDGEALTNFTTNQTFEFEMISRDQGGLEFNGQIQEIILYSSTQSSNRTGIEDNINNHYSIY